MSATTMNSNGEKKSENLSAGNKPDISAVENTPIVVLRNVYKSYNDGRLPVLDDFSMTVQKGNM